MPKNKKEVVIKVEDLSISFATDQGRLHAVRGVDFELNKGEVLAIVGESGSGKSVSAKTIMGILPRNGRVEKGKIMYNGEDLTKISEEEFNRIRGRKIGMIFQDPLSSLNPIMKIGKQVTEAIIIHSDKLKRMYNDLISDANIAYLNEKTHLRGQILDSEFALANLKTETRIAINKIRSKKDYSHILDPLKKEIIEPVQNELHQVQKTFAEAQEAKRLEMLKLRNNHRSEVLKIAEKDIAKDAKEEQIKRLKEEHKVALQEHEKALEALKIEAKAKIKPHQELLKQAKAEAKAKAKIKAAELRTQEPTKEENKAAIKELKVAYTTQVRVHKTLKHDVTLAAKPVIAEKKMLLKEAKISAKKEVDAHKEALKAEYKAEYAVLADKKKNETSKDRIREIDNEMRALRLEFVDKVKIRPSVAKKMAVQVMEEVGIPNAARRYKQYPFEFSGGMRQRIVIAIALIQNPDILICDEPTTALDVTIQAQILELILRLKRERELSVIFITHDLGVVANMADRVAVMYAGQIVESGTAEEIFYDPRHPYTWALLSSIPDVDSKERLEAIPGTPPNMIYPPVGDAFAARSKYAMEVDYIEAPPNIQITPTHFARTWLLDERAPKAEMPKIVSERIRISLEKEGKK